MDERAHVLELAIVVVGRVVAVLRVGLLLHPAQYDVRVAGAALLGLGLALFGLGLAAAQAHLTRDRVGLHA